MAKILLVEDDRELTYLIAEWLGDEDHLVEVVHTGADGLDRLRFYSYDLVIMDWDLPELKGIEIVKRFRSQGGNTPVLMLTGRKEIEDKELGLDSGADDYLTKPFLMQELSLRVKALLRRLQKTSQPAFAEGGLVLDAGASSVRSGSQTIQLTPAECALLEFLMRNPNRAFSAEAIKERVFAAEREVTANAVRIHITRLRKKLAATAGSELISTLPQEGYRFNSG